MNVRIVKRDALLQIAAVTLVVVLPLVLFLGGCQGQKPKYTVQTAEAGIKALEINVEIAGSLAPEEAFNISAKMGGKVRSANFETGESVKKGQVLITLDTSELNAQLTAAQKAYDNALAKAETARGSMTAAEEKWKRMQVLYDEGAIPQVQVKQAQSEYENAKTAFNSANGTPLRQAKAALDNVSSQLANANVVSPISGVIITKNIQVGEVASPGVSLGTVADISTLKLKGTVDQDIFPFLEMGQQMDITVDAFPENAYAGTITLLGPISVGTGNYFPIELTLSNPGELAAGMAASTDILITRDLGIVVPSSAIIKDGKEIYLYVVEAGVTHKRAVKLGFSNGDDVEITEGVKQGEMVALTNLNKLKDNMLVRVQEE